MKRDLVVSIALISLYWVLWHASTVFEYAPHASLWFAPSGLVVAILLLWKRSGFFKAWISVVTLSVFAQLTIYASPGLWHSLLISTAVATSATLPYWLALQAFYRFEAQSGQRVSGSLLRPILYSVLTLAGALGAAVLGILSLVTISDLPIADAGSIWLAWWIGDFVGVTILAPAFVLIGVKFFDRWTEPQDTLLVENSRAHGGLPTETAAWVSVVLIVLLPSITAVARSEIDDRIPTIFAFMLALLPIALLATRASWAVIVTVGVLSSLSTICTVKYVGVIGDGFPYQTALLAMIITAFYFHAFVNVVDSQSRQLETSATEQNKLKAWASHDPLTGALNRQAMSEKFEQMLQRSRVAEEQLGVIMLDIDRFKSINDQHGHNIGDDVLIRFVKIVGQSTRANDVCLRWGGEEFVVLSLVTSMAALEVLAENLRRQVATARFEGIPPFTCSVGVALHREGESLRQLLGRADEALYQSKKTGRNRVSAALALDLSYLGCWQSIQAHA